MLLFYSLAPHSDMEQPQLRSPLVMMALVAAGTLNCEMEGSQLSDNPSSPSPDTT